MRRWIQIVGLLIVVAGCSRDDSVPYLGNDGRTGEYAAAGIGELDEIVWKRRFPAGLAVAPGALRQTLFVGRTDGYLTAVSTTDGENIWELQLGGAVHGTPVVTSERVVVGTDVGLVAVSFDGRQQWSYDTAPIETAPLVIDSVAYVGTRDGRILAIDVVGGSLIWEAVTAGPVLAGPVRVGDSVVFGSDDGGVYCIDLRTGEPRWTWSARAPVRGLAAAAGTVYVVAGQNLTAIANADPQSSKWRADLGRTIETPPALMGGLVVVGTGERIIAVDTADGSPIFRKEVSSPLRGAISIVAGDIVAPATQGGLVVLDRAGKERWKFKTDDVVTGVMPVGERLYVVDAAGSLYALR